MLLVCSSSQNPTTLVVGVCHGNSSDACSRSGVGHGYGCSYDGDCDGFGDGGGCGDADGTGDGGRGFSVDK